MNSRFLSSKKEKKRKSNTKRKKEKKEKLFTNVNNFFQSLLFQEVNKEKKEKEKVTQKEKERKEIINQSLFGLSFRFIFQAVLNCLSFKLFCIECFVYYFVSNCLIDFLSSFSFFFASFFFLFLLSYFKKVKTH